MAHPTRHLSLIVPAALGPVDLGRDAHLPTLPNFSRLLARAQRQPCAALDYEALLATRFGVESGPVVPVAPLTYALEQGAPPAGWCQRADPVLMVPGRTSLMVMGWGEALALTLAEAEEYVAALNHHFATAGLCFVASTPYHWYCTTAAPAELITSPLGEVQGRSVRHHLPRGADGGGWNGLLAEAQMLLHQHPRNQARAAEGLPLVNSVWFWGGGVMPPVRAEWSRLWSSEPLALALALAAGTPRSDAPATAVEWLARAEAGTHLLTLDGLAPHLPELPAALWAEVMQAWEAAWWRPLLQALRGGQISGLSLYPLDGHAYHLDRRAARRWWRPTPALAGRLQRVEYEAD